MTDSNQGDRGFPDTTVRVESKKGLSLVKAAYMGQKGCHVSVAQQSEPLAGKFVPLIRRYTSDQF